MLTETLNAALLGLVGGAAVLGVVLQVLGFRVVEWLSAMKRVHGSFRLMVGGFWVETFVFAFIAWMGTQIPFDRISTEDQACILGTVSAILHLGLYVLGRLVTANDRS